MYMVSHHPRIGIFQKTSHIIILAQLTKCYVYNDLGFFYMIMMIIQSYKNYISFIFKILTCKVWPTQYMTISSITKILTYIYLFLKSIGLQVDTHSLKMVSGATYF